MKLLTRRENLTAILRKWPAPFEAAMAICNDIDCTTFADYLAIHRFLNTTAPTPFGDGLGLPIANSFWMFSVQPEHDPGFAYFADMEGTPSPIAPRVRELFHAGLLDVLHTYGNFSQHGGFRRRHAEIAANEMLRWGMRPRVWVNHGDCHNFQNIHGTESDATFAGGRLSRRGADGVPVRNLEYHLDITHELGVRFLWVHELTQDIGQDRPLPARERIFKPNALKRKRWLRRDLSDFSQAWLKPAGCHLRRGMFENRLLKPYPLEPGPFYRFRRFGKYGPDCMQHLPTLLSDETLDALVASRGVSVLFAHLGKRPDPGSPVFNAASADALRGLARRYHQGQLYVETTSRLLHYIAVRDALTYAVKRRGEHVVLEIGEVNDPVLGRFVPDADDLAGMCFDVRAHLPPIVSVCGRVTTVALRRKTSNHFSVCFPRIPLDPGDLLGP